ncbi:MAG: hypothetical protein ACOCXW_00380 [Bacteroidota bacterium]
MILRLFRGYNPFIIILIPLIGLLIWLQAFNGVPERLFLFDVRQQPFFKLLFEFAGEQSFLSASITLMITLFCGFLLVRLNTLYIFIPDRTYMPALFFIIISGSYIPLQRLNPVVFGAIFLIFALDRIMSGYRKEGLIYNSLEASFLLSLGSMFYSGVLFFLPLVWVGLVFFRPGYWREWLFSIIGFLLPYLFLFSWFFIIDRPVLSYLESLGKIFSLEIESTAIRFHYLAFYVYTGFLVLLSSFHIMKQLPLKKILPRRSYIIFFWNFAFGLIAIIIIPAISYEMLPLLAIPVSFLLSHYFMSTRGKLVPELLIIFFFLLVILIQVMEVRVG